MFQVKGAFTDLISNSMPVFVLDCLEILTLSNMLISLKWIVNVFSNSLTIDEDKHRISDHNYLQKVLQTCL